MQTLDYAQLENELATSEVRDNNNADRLCNSCDDPITTINNKFCICMKCVTYLSEFGADLAILM
jgi:hypothetical protein